MHKPINTSTILFVIGMAMGLSACDRNYETIFNESTDDRVRRALDEYNTLLKEAPHGWRAVLYTGSNAGYFYYFDFEDGGTVTMMSDFDETTSGEPMSGTWMMKALQKPTLSFDTYSYIHLPADPDGNVNGGVNGDGLISDFEFTFTRTSGDSVILKGLKHNTEMTFIKATQQEAESILAARIQGILLKTQDYTDANKGLRLLLPDNSVVPVAIDVSRKVFAAQYLSDDNRKIETFVSPFTFSLGGLILKSPLNINGQSIREFQWSDDRQAYFIPFETPRDLVNSPEAFIFNPAVPLHDVIGKDYKVVYIPENPEENRLPGQSDAFIEAYNDTALNLITDVFEYTLHDMALVFNPATAQMYYRLIVSGTRDGVTSRYLAEYVFSYTTDAAGNLDFTPIQANDLGNLISFNMRLMLQYLENETFQLEYIAGGFNLIGGFYSQHDNGFAFSGVLTN